MLRPPLLLCRFLLVFSFGVCCHKRNLPPRSGQQETIRVISNDRRVIHLNVVYTLKVLLFYLFIILLATETFTHSQIYSNYIKRLIISLVLDIFFFSCFCLVYLYSITKYFYK